MAQPWAEKCTLRGHSDFVWTCAFSPDGSTVLSGSRDNTLKLWDARSGKEKCTLRGHSDMVLACAFSPDGSTVLSGCFDGSLKLWENVSTPPPPAPVPPPMPPPPHAPVSLPVPALPAQTHPPELDAAAVARGEVREVSVAFVRRCTDGFATAHGRLLGRGAFGSVFRGFDESSGLVFAAKVLDAAAPWGEAAAAMRSAAGTMRREVEVS